MTENRPDIIRNPTLETSPAMRPKPQSGKAKAGAGKGPAKPGGFGAGGAGTAHDATRMTRLLLRFLKALPPAGAALSGTARGTDSATVELATSSARLRVEPAILLLAARQGLIRRDGARIRPLPEAESFIVRHAAIEPDFARPHRDLAEATVAIDGEIAHVTRNLAESPLSALERLKGRAGQAYFPREAMAAGERLHADFTRGQLQPQITMRFEPRLASSVKGARGGVADLSDSAVAARLRVNRALAALGPELSGVALDICCFMKGLETVERERQWPPRSAKLMLKTALLALHRHYTPPARREMRQWGEEGFRPEM